MAKKRTHKTLVHRLGVSLRNRDWFTVGAEFLIVTAGVFLGIQAANFNEERLARQDERAILERLHDETSGLLEAVKAEGEELQAIADELVNAQPILFSAQAERPLTFRECRAIVSSHVYRKPIDELPVLDELLSTGRFDRLLDSELKDQLRSYILFRDRERGTHEERTNELFRLYSRYPELISLGLTTEADDTSDLRFSNLLSAEGYQWDRRCDVRGMRQSQPFLNDLFDNMARSGNVLNSNDKREAMLAELLGRLDELLAS